MKFEKFIKRAGIHVLTLTDTESNKWAYNDGVMMIIPDGVNVTGTSTATIPERLTDEIYSSDVMEYEEDQAYLDRAELPADGKAKDIERIYKLGSDEIRVNNADWSLIESSDVTTIIYDDNGETIALAIYNRHGDVEGVIFADSIYLINKIKEENNNGN